ncbi:GNAT family N-acetyltransferase [Rhodobacter ferrooxidans]|uniref:GCN5-related N-acetyltransferase n=1 Tax=Rhodobacter ferrooxidans TaxID=371731 RepID=C8RZU7_9RHOB|nr:GNAT family N-acetyltransferase [Rhodobacter sp. SW2]EEW25894.1 GCN5-related N-acetyltransferase [Rhodobacter sp. SW2]
MIGIRRDSPLAPDVLPLLQRHVDLMWASSPAESVHVLDPAALAVEGVAFYTLRDKGEVLGMGALSRIDAGHAEIKSMHIVAEARGRGLARVLLTHLVTEARGLGYRRLSLETGVEPIFAAARALYASAGFEECPPFAGYTLDPNSIFMTRAL